MQNIRGPAASPPSYGHCGDTAENNEGNCGFGSQGSFRKAGTALGRAMALGDWNGSAAACLQRCVGCPRCSYISLSLRYRDCSWYAACPTIHPERHFRSHFVKRVARGPEWEPTWNKSCEAPPHQGSPSCAFWGSHHCGASFPQAGTHPVRLRRWAACSPPAQVASWKRRLKNEISWYQGISPDDLAALAPVDPATLSSVWKKTAGGCVSRDCVMNALAGRWIMFMGGAPRH